MNPGARAEGRALRDGGTDRCAAQAVTEDLGRALSTRNAFPRRSGARQRPGRGWSPQRPLSPEAGGRPLAVPASGPLPRPCTRASRRLFLL